MFEAGDIRQRRAELNMWRSELAAKVGVDRRQIRRYESGEPQPTLPIAKAIASALGITDSSMNWRARTHTGST